MTNDIGLFAQLKIVIKFAAPCLPQKELILSLHQ
jgi:hypothetical protein